MQTFKPSPLSAQVTAVLDKGQVSQPTGREVVAGQRPSDRRNPLFKTRAETMGEGGSMAYHMRTRDPRCRDSINEYEVLPGGRTVYFSGAEKRLVPYGPDDIPVEWTAGAPVPGPDPFELRRSRASEKPTTLAFPDDRSFSGHGRPVSGKLGR